MFSFFLIISKGIYYRLIMEGIKTEGSYYSQDSRLA
jgi:hypothetical protein